MAQTSSLLSEMLSMAVPLQIMRLHQRGGPNGTDWDTLEQINAELGEKGDLLLFRNGQHGESAWLFNNLAYALAVLAHLPGGVTAFGLHWEEEPREPVQMSLL